MLVRMAHIVADSPATRTPCVEALLADADIGGVRRALVTGLVSNMAVQRAESIAGFAEAPCA